MRESTGSIEVEYGEATVGGYRIHARRFVPPDESKATLVLVHGMVLAGRSMLGLARALARRGLEVRLPDLPGFGRSDKPDRALDVPGLGRALSSWMRSAVDGPAVVVGNSFGTQVAASAVAGEPGTSVLVLVAPTIDDRFRSGWISLLPEGRPPSGRHEGAVANVQRQLVDRLVVDPAPEQQVSLRRLLLSEYAAAGPSRALSTYRHALRDDLVATLAGVECPLVVVRGEQDGVVSKPWAAKVAGAARRPGRCVEVAGVDHDAQFKAPERLAAAILDEVEPMLSR